MAALSGYWGGISDDKTDDFSVAFSNDGGADDMDNDEKLEEDVEGNLRTLERLVVLIHTVTITNIFISERGGTVSRLLIC